MKEHNWQDISATDFTHNTKTWYCARCGGLAYTSLLRSPTNRIFLRSSGQLRELTCDEAIVAMVLER